MCPHFRSDTHHAAWRRDRLRGTGAAAAWLAGTLSVAAWAAPPLKLHVPSPDWRDQVLYFVMTDRFADGDSRNNDQGRGEYDPADRTKYSGGDLRGLVQRLSYIRGLGATGLWITPPVANQWVDPVVRYTGYHGYWAEHFKRVDRHLGSLDDYRRLSHALHSAGMVLVQDIVLNHTGNFFGYGSGYRADDPARDLVHRGRPTQWPFSLNDPRDPAQRRAGIYHWTPDVTDYSDPVQERRFQMSGLDDLATGSPPVRRALRDSYGYWIREVGVDAFRVDTAFYVEPELFADFLRAKDAKAPGVEHVARATGRRDFLVFGEGFGIDRPFDDTQARKIERYMTAPDGRALMPGMLNFPLYGALGDVFARGRPTAELGHRIAAAMTLHARPHLMPSFVDNHDVDRFLAGGSVPGLKQALLAMFTLPGIPVVYYGTEQGFTAPRASMFAAGWGAGGRDHFDTSAPLYRHVAALAALRREHRLFSRGVPAVLATNAAAAGAIAWRMQQGAEAAIVVMNSAEDETLADAVDTGLPPGTRLRGVFGLDGVPADVVVGPDGRVTWRLPPRSGFVWRAEPAPVVPIAAPGAGLPVAAAAPSVTMAPLANQRVGGDFVVEGAASGAELLRLVVDGDLARAQTVRPAADGRWQATVDTSRMVDAAVLHRVVAWAPAGGGMAGGPSAAREFRVERPWAVLADTADPAGDDTGPAGRYVYPLEPPPGPRRTMDLRRVRVLGAGTALQIELEMAELSKTWNPLNGFDHVAFTVFIELPGREGGATAMPFQNAAVPAGMRWHVRLRAHGWTNAVFASDGASATADGRPVTPSPLLSVDEARRTVRLTVPAATLGLPASLSGARLYVTTWDYDGGYRRLSPQAGGGVIGGGDGSRDPLVMDDTAVIVLR